jgi:hypothetical protein
MPELRDGSVTNDARLDRLQDFDPRSREYPVGAVLPSTDLKSKTWFIRPRLDQGQQGACVSFAWTHDLVGSPVPVKFDDANQYARDQYWEMQKIDPWAGGSYPGASPQYEGTAVLAGAKITQRNGYIEEYRWGFGIDDVLATIANFGPVVLASSWLRSMFEPRPSGLLEVDFSSPSDGGHAYPGRGVSLKPRLKGESKLGPVVRVRNSWGPDWGVQGDCFIKVEDLERLLREGGEACVPIGRKK